MIFLLHQAGLETARQTATSAKRHALAITPCLSIDIKIENLDKSCKETSLGVSTITNMGHKGPISVYLWNITLA